MLPDPVILAAFVPAALALNLTPGADMLTCLGIGIGAGPRAAVAAALGVTLGCMVHVAVAAAGLGALLATHPAAFEVIRWAGVAYLCLLAWRALRGSGPGTAAAIVLRPAQAFRRGLVVNLLNPKVALFVLAFLPQFVDAAAPVAPQVLILGAILSLGGLAVNAAVGAGAAGLGRALAQSATAARWLSRISACVFVALAARLALAPRG